MRLNLKYLVLAFCSLCLQNLLAQSTSWTGITSTSWNVATNWTNGIPSSSIDAVIGDASFTGANQPNVNVTSNCKSLTIGNSTKASTVTMARSLTAYGNVLIGANGTIFANTGSRTLFCRANFTNNGTYNATSSTAGVTLSGGINQTFTGVTTFRKFTINSGSTLVLASNITINNSLSVSGTLEPSTFTIGGTGTLTVNSTGIIKVYTATFAGNYALSGAVSLNRTSTVDYAATALAQTVSSSFTYGTLIISGGSTKSLSANLPGLSSGSTTSGKLYVNAGIFDLKSFTANRNASGGGSLTIAAGASLLIGGTNTFPTNYLTLAIATTSTVEYYGNSQTVTATTYGNLTLKAGAGAITKTMPATAMTIAGNFIMDVATGTSLSATAAQALTINGNFTIGTSCSFSGASFSHIFKSNFTNSGTFTGSTSTVTFSGISSTLSGTGTNNFNNLVFTAYGITGAGTMSISVSGNLSTTTPGLFTHASTGTVTMTGAAKTISGNGFAFYNFIISGTASVTSTAIMTVTGNFTNNGSFSASAGTFTMDGTSTTIGGSAAPAFFALDIEGTVSTSISISLLSNLSVSGTGSFSANAGTTTFNGTSTLHGSPNLYNVTINAAKTLALGSSSILGIASVFTKTGTLDVTTYIPNSVNYNSSSNQTLASASYNNLLVSNGGTKVPAAAITVNNDFTIQSGVTFNALSYVFTLYRHWNNLGSFICSTSDVQFRGSNSGTITGATTFNTLTVNKTSSTIKVILQNDISAASIVMTTGNMNTDVNTITTTGGRTGNGIIIGTVKHQHSFSTAVAYSFEGPNNLITFTNPSGITSVTVKSIIGEIADFDPAIESVIREYEVTIPAGTYTSAKFRYHYENNELNAFAEPFLSIYKFNSGTTWDSIGFTGRDTAANYVELSGITAMSGRFSASGIRNVVRWNGSVSTNWNTAANWTTVSGSNMSNRVPTSTDAAQIGTAAFTNQPTVSTTQIVSVLRFGSAQAATLTISGGNLTSSGSIRGQWSTSRSHTISISSGALNSSTNLQLSDGTDAHDITLNIAGGTVNVFADLIQSNTSTIAFSGAGNMVLSGDYLYTGGTFTAGSGTVTYSGGEAQTVAALTYNHLAFSKSTSRANISSNTNVAGNMTLTNSGEVYVSDTLTITGNLSVADSTMLETDNTLINVGGNFSKTGIATFVPNNGGFNFNGNSAQSVNSNTFNNLYVNKSAGTLSLTGNLTINGNLIINSGTVDLDTFNSDRSFVGGTLTLASAANILVSGPSNFPSKFQTNTLNSNSTVTYDGTVAQSIKNLNYGNLSLTGGGSNAKSLIGNITINGNFTIAAASTFNPDIYSIILNGNFTNSGTYTPGTSTMTLNGTSKTITGATTFYNLSVVTGSYTVSSGTTNIAGDLYVETTGTLSFASNNVVLDGDLTNKGSLSSNATATFTGNQVQTLRLLSSITSTSTGIINFNGSVSPVINSSSSPSFATVNINNTGGITPSVPWTVYFAFNVAAGATFDGGPLNHRFYGNFTNNGTVLSTGVLNFTPGAPFSASAAIKLDGVSFNSSGEVIFGGTAPITITQVAPVLTNVSITNTHANGVTALASWTISDELRIGPGATFKAGTATSHLISGALINNGTLDGQTSTFRFDGSPCEINGDGVSTFYTLKVESTADLALNCDINVLRNLIVDANFSADGAIISFTGSLASTISGAVSPIILADVTQNKSGNTTTLSVPVTITGDLVLSLGNILTSASNYLNIADDATSTSGSALSFVIGPMRKTGDDAFVFPVGKGLNWGRLGISAPSNVTDAFTAEYFNNAYTNIATMAGSPSPVLYNVSMQEYWICDRTTGTSNVTVQLFWENSLSGINNYSSDLVVARWNGSAWENKGQSAITGATPGNVTSNTVTSFSPFTFGSLSAFVNPLPVKLISFDGTLQADGKVELKWRTSSEEDNHYFTIERSRDGEHFTELVRVESAGNSSAIQDYLTFDALPYSGISYYRLRQTDLNGNSNYSKTIVIINNKNSESAFYIYPNPSTGVVNVELDTKESGQISIKSITGEVLDIIEITDNTFTLDLSSYPLGIYFLELETGNSIKTVKLLRR